MHLRGPSTGGREGPIDHTADAAERFAEVAAERGVDEIGFTEHLYYFHEFEALVEHPYQRARIGHDLETYVAAVTKAKERGLPVKLGLEVDFYPGRAGGRDLSGARLPRPLPRARDPGDDRLGRPPSGRRRARLRPGGRAHAADGLRNGHSLRRAPGPPGGARVSEYRIGIGVDAH